jgi:cytochrome c oxidase subunit 2
MIRLKLLASSVFLLGSNVQRLYGNKTPAEERWQNASTSIRDSVGVPDRGDERALRLAPPAQGASAKIRSAPTRATVDKGEIYFESGKSDLTADAQQNLNDIAQSLKDNTAWKIEIVGYSDPRGNKTSNLLLSKQRAETVREYLQAHGIAGSRLRVTVGGEDSSTGAGSNPRRVQIVWH